MAKSGKKEKKEKVKIRKVEEIYDRRMEDKRLTKKFKGKAVFRGFPPW